MVRLKTLDILNVTPKDSGDEYWISRFIQPVKPLYYPLKGHLLSVTAGALGGNITLFPPCGEVWEVHYISGSHNDVAARAVTMFLTLHLTNLPIGINVHITEDNDWAIPAGKPFPIYPVLHQTAPAHDHVNNHVPIILDGRQSVIPKTPNSFLNIYMEDLVAGKIFTVNVAYKRLV